MFDDIRMARFEEVALPDGHLVYTCRLTEEMIDQVNSESHFDQLWTEHPSEHSLLEMFGRYIPMKRWQQAYERDYKFNKNVAKAKPIIPALIPYLDWSRLKVDSRLNGLLVNWYDGAQNHHITPHHDNSSELVAGSPIVTISLGEERVFRFTLMENRRKVDQHDLIAVPGNAIVTPWDTNQRWKHSVPHFARYRGKRISITLRAFVD